MSIRITEDMRRALLQRLIDHRFGRESKALKRTEHDLAVAFYKAIYDAPTRKAMDALQEGWLPTTHRIRFKLHGRGGNELSAMSPVRITFLDQGMYLHISKRAEGALRERLEQLRTQQSDLSKRQRELSDKTRTALAGFTTISRLVKAWPEVKPFVTQLGFDDPAKALPAVIPQGLNESLGIAAASN